MKQKNKGVAMVELAIVLPLLMFLFFGIVEVGRALYLQNSLVKTVGITARMIARSYNAIDVENNCTITAQWQAKVDEAKQLLEFGDIDGADQPLLKNIKDIAIEVSEKPLPNFSSSTCIIQVSAKATFTPLVSDTLFGFPTFDLNATAQERYIGE